MPIALRDDVMCILLKKIHEQDGSGKHAVDFKATDFTGRNLDYNKKLPIFGMMIIL